MHVDQQDDHANVARDGYYVDGRGGLFANIDFLVGDVIAHCQGLVANC